MALNYSISGDNVNPAPCTNVAANSTCTPPTVGGPPPPLLVYTPVPPPPLDPSALPNPYPPQLEAGSLDSVYINYSINTTAIKNATSTVTLKGCYSAEAAKNRKWRKANDVIAKDKQCTVKILWRGGQESRLLRD